MPLRHGRSAASSACPAASNAAWSGTGAAKLFDRVISVKSANLTLSVTVRPLHLGALDPLPRRSPATRAQLAAQRRRGRSDPSSKVRSALTDL